ncbi:hypothetical protein QYF36_022638 [Acer negundo]|nr:hypothetical protein QYF36_022638 [Acer negundo]
MVLFYSKNDFMTNRLDHQTHKRLAMLKKSLSHTLTRFYPLAGKIKDDLSIECNEEGAYYVETGVNCCLDEFLNQPDIVLLVHKFLPCEPILKESSARTYLTNIQVNVLIRSEEGDNNMIMSESLRKIGELACRERVDYLGFTSWCKLGFYEMDFGWGKPIWVSSIGSSGSLVLNLVILVETRSGDGIESWMTLDEQDMAIL